MNNYIYVPGLSEKVEEELKEELQNEELKKKENPKKLVSITGAKKRYAQYKSNGELKLHLEDDRSVSVPMWEKYALTIKEASQYYNIPEFRLKSYILSHQNECFILRVGNRRLIKRRIFEDFLDDNQEI